jgi:hypothetical protein
VAEEAHRDSPEEVEEEEHCTHNNDSSNHSTAVRNFDTIVDDAALQEEPVHQEVVGELHEGKALVAAFAVVKKQQRRQADELVSETIPPAVSFLHVAY